MADKRPTCGSCGAVYRRLQAATRARYEVHARSAGWRIQADGDGVMCPRCARPDPDLVRLCRELAKPARHVPDGAA